MNTVSWTKLVLNIFSYLNEIINTFKSLYHISLNKNKRLKQQTWFAILAYRQMHFNVNSKNVITYSKYQTHFLCIKSSSSTTEQGRLLIGYEITQNMTEKNLTEQRIMQNCGSNIEAKLLLTIWIQIFVYNYYIHKAE